MGRRLQIDTPTFLIDETTNRKFYDDQVKTRELLNSLPSVETLKEEA